MRVIEYARHRYDAVLAEVERLKHSEFPYEHSREALIELEKVFKQQATALGMLTPQTTPEVAKNACSQSLYSLFNYTPFLGFILRSTNVRNSFELYAPLLRLSRKILDSNIKLLLSSEWDYSPFVFLPNADLSQFVLIGLPAQESSNPLLIALAGHELGHKIWQQHQLANEYDSLIKQAVIEALQNQFWPDYHQVYPQFTKDNLENNIFARETWVPAHSWGLRQLEEVFCDVIGLRLFAEAYLHAFAYLVAPGNHGCRDLFYPKIYDRVRYLEKAANALIVKVPDGFGDFFDFEDEPKEPITKILVSAADVASALLIDKLIEKVKELADSKSVPVRSDKQVAAIVNDFRMVVPANGLATMTDILNAGWIAYQDPNLWSDVRQITSADRTRVLHDLILKSFEVAEVHERIAEP